MKIALVTLTLLTSFGLNAQTEGGNPERKVVTPPPPPRIIVVQGEIPPGPPFDPTSEEICDFPDIESEFPGGAMAMRKFIQENVQYPEYSLKHNEQGRVYLSFVVEKDGSISGIDIPRSLTPSLDQEAIRLVASMPKWIPGTVQGIPVRSRCRLPITFILDTSDDEKGKSKGK